MRSLRALRYGRHKFGEGCYVYVTKPFTSRQYSTRIWADVHNPMTVYPKLERRNGLENFPLQPPFESRLEFGWVVNVLDGEA